MQLKVEITYKKINNLHLRVKDGIIKVSSPFYVSKERINKFINDNMDFINNQLNKQEIKKEKNKIEINQKITLLDKEYEVIKTSGKAKLTEHFIFVNEDADIKKQIKYLFKDKLFLLFQEKTKQYYDIMYLPCNFPKITIKDVKSKWGSYNKVKHEIIYSSELLFKDKQTYDYIIVHELSHILQFDHSKKFYDIVSKYCPNYKVLRKRLRGD